MRRKGRKKEDKETYVRRGKERCGKKMQGKVGDKKKKKKCYEMSHGKKHEEQREERHVEVRE